MKIAIFSREANPSIDPPLFFADTERYKILLGSGAIQSIGTRRAQFTCEQRDPIKRAQTAKRAAQTVYTDGGENGREWRIVHQTKPGFGPGQPEYQLVP